MSSGKVDYVRTAGGLARIFADTLWCDADPVLTALVATSDYKARLERIFRLHLETFDWNCPQHITARFTEQDIVLRGELVAASSAFLKGLVAVALEHEVGGAPDVDLGYHGNRLHVLDR